MLVNNAPNDKKQIAFFEKNELGNNKDKLAWQNPSETFPSLGIIHATWGAAGNSFHSMITYMQKTKKVRIPNDLSFITNKNPPQDWT